MHKSVSAESPVEGSDGSTRTTTLILMRDSCFDYFSQTNE